MMELSERIERRNLKIYLKERLSLERSLSEGCDMQAVTLAIQKQIERIGKNLCKEARELLVQERDSIISEIVDDLVGLGPLEQFLKDPEVTEIMVNGPDAIFIEKAGVKVETGVWFDSEEHLRYLIQKMIACTGKRIDDLSPYVDICIVGGSRVNMVIPPVAFGGPYVTIRKAIKNLVSMDQLLSHGTLDGRMAQFLMASVKARCNILFSGASGCGKTTTMEIMSALIPEHERIVVIEDTLEINLPHKNQVRLLTRDNNIEGKGEVTIRELFRNSLRMRPSRILLGEIRGEEALDYLQALSSGHQGSLAVIHASSPEDALGRMESLVLYSGMPLPISVIRSQMVRGLDLLVQQSQLDDGSRKIVRISEVAGISDGGNIQLNDVFHYQQHEEAQGKGEFCATGYLPEALGAIRRAGITLPDGIFTQPETSPQLNEVDAPSCPPLSSTPTTS